MLARRTQLTNHPENDALVAIFGNQTLTQRYRLILVCLPGDISPPLGIMRNSYFVRTTF